MAEDRLDERTFCTQVCTEIATILHDNPALPFAIPDTEIHTKSGKRIDILLPLKNSRKSALLIEVKMPDTIQGRSPYDDSLVKDARDKRDDVANPPAFFATWNVRNLVIWDPKLIDRPLSERVFRVYSLSEIATDDLTLAWSETLRSQVSKFLRGFLPELAEIVQGKASIPKRPLDEKAIDMLHAALDAPIATMRSEIHARCNSDETFKRNLIHWLRQKLDWEYREDTFAKGVKLAAQQASYIFLLKLAFYLLLRRTFRGLSDLPEDYSITLIGDFSARIIMAFHNAKLVSGDYETVFEFGDKFGESLAFLSDLQTHYWIGLIHDLKKLELDKIDYDILGHLWERLMDVTERHRFGQHFTRTEAVDLINSFCIHTPRAKVFDPACGGGTFLVRAYQRKKRLSEENGKKPPSHKQLLSDIFGVDINEFPALVSTINLAVRNLIKEANYPSIAVSDFFKVTPGKGLFRSDDVAPYRDDDDLVRTKGGKRKIGEVDAIVGNPPYIEQEEIPEKQKERIWSLLERDFPLDPPKLSKRSDIYAYFWAHGFKFLKPAGYIALVTSNMWLDSDYGVKLQRFFLKHFKVIAVLEQEGGLPWFSLPRVRTTITILQREDDSQRRAKNIVRFVLLKKPLEAMAPQNQLRDNPLWADKLRDEILSSGCDSLTDTMRIRVKRQADLLKEGNPAGAEGAVEIDLLNGTIQEEKKKSALASIEDGYSFGKWGIPLRAPDLFFQLLEIAGPRLVPLNKMADIKRGITSGADEFFFVRDVSELLKAKPDLLFHDYRLEPKDLEQIRIVRGPGGEHFKIEAKYLEPVLFNLMEVNQIEISQAQCKRLVLLVHEDKAALKGTHALDYIKKGEREGKYHLRSTCAARKPWYSLPDIRGPIVWSMIHQYKHIAAYNLDKLAVNHNMFVISPHPAVDEDLLLAVLNSTIQELIKRLYGRLRNEGVIKTEGIDLAIMPVVNCMLLGKSQSKKVLRSFHNMKTREIRQIVNVGTRGSDLSQEIGLEDRRILDLSVLEALGIAGSDAGSWLDSLYALLKETYRLERIGELQMVAGRQGETKQGRIRPELLADEIWHKELGAKKIRHFPDHFVEAGIPTVQVHMPAHFTEDKREHHVDKFQSRLVKGETAIESPHEGGLAMLEIAAELRISGDISIPINSDVAFHVAAEFRTYWKKFKQIVKEYVEKRSPEAKRQKAISAAIFEMYRNREPVGTGDLVE